MTRKERTLFKIIRDFIIGVGVVSAKEAIEALTELEKHVDNARN